MLTQTQLKELLNYNPKTGHFTWEVVRGNARIGLRAGSLSRNGYIEIRIYNQLYKAHRLVFLYLYGEVPPDEVDPINHDRIDNRRENLRRVSKTDNCRNASIGSTNTSGTVGVSPSKGKWKAYIGNKAETIRLGTFENKEDAIKSRKAAEKKYGYHPNHGLTNHL